MGQGEQGAIDNWQLAQDLMDLNLPIPHCPLIILVKLHELSFNRLEQTENLRRFDSK